MERETGLEPANGLWRALRLATDGDEKGVDGEILWEVADDGRRARAGGCGASKVGTTEVAEIERKEPQSAVDYDDRTTDAVKSVLVEIGQILGSFKGKFAVVGGAVPWLLLNNEDMPHVGSLDVDLGLDAEALGDGEYATLVEALKDKVCWHRNGPKISS
jgi:hypothetical protein